MTTQPTCDRCAKPVHDTAYVCGHCASELEKRLALLATLAGEATVTIAKLDEISNQAWNPEIEEDVGKAPNALYPMALPIDLRAAAKHQAAVVVLLTWAKDVAETRGLTVVVEHSEHPLAVLSTWLVLQVGWLRYRQQAAEAFADLHQAVHDIEAVVDRLPDRWYAGPCDNCQEDLYPASGARTIRCTCGAEYDPDKRKAKLLRDLDDIWDTADQCAHAMVSLGLPAKASTIRTWADRGRLAPHPDSPQGRPWYRIGSVRELVEHAQTEERDRTLRKAVKEAEAAERRARRERVTT